MNSKVETLKKLTNTKWLNLYEVDYEKNGKIFDMYFSSRKKVGMLDLENPSKIINDGSVVVPILNEDTLVMVKQYRPITDTYEIEFPAGLSKSDESPEDCASRELKEETNLNIVSLICILPPRHSATGLTDERTAIYVASVKGNINTKGLEESEELDLIKVNIKDIPRFVKENNVCQRDSMIALYIYADLKNIIQKLNQTSKIKTSKSFKEDK